MSHLWIQGFGSEGYNNIKHQLFRHSGPPLFQDFKKLCVEQICKQFKGEIYLNFLSSQQRNPKLSCLSFLQHIEVTSHVFTHVVAACFYVV